MVEVSKLTGKVNELVKDLEACKELRESLCKCCKCGAKLDTACTCAGEECEHCCCEACRTEDAPKAHRARVDMAWD